MIPGMRGPSSRPRVRRRLCITSRRCRCGNVVANLTGASVVPYATVRIGGLTAFSKPSVGASTDTFFTHNVGGVKWYAPSGRWGLRGDDRFIGLTSKNDASAFFGPDNRYAHRFYGGVITNAFR